MSQETREALGTIPPQEYEALLLTENEPLVDKLLNTIQELMGIAEQSHKQLQGKPISLEELKVEWMKDKEPKLSEYIARYPQHRFDFVDWVVFGLRMEIALLEAPEEEIPEDFKQRSEIVISEVMANFKAQRNGGPVSEQFLRAQKRLDAHLALEQEVK